MLIPENADDATIGRLSVKAEEIATSAKGGADFVKLVAENSESASKDKQGDIGIVAKGELISALDQAVFNTQAGGVVGPLRTRGGLHVVKVEERIPSEIPSFDSVKEKLRLEASEDAFQRDYKSYIERLRKEAFIVVNSEQIPTVS